MAAGQPPNPRQFGHEFADLEQDEIAQQTDAAGSSTIGIVPFLMLAHGVVLFGSELDPPRILLNTYFYMTFEAQFALAIMLGVALASGFQDRDGSS